MRIVDEVSCAPAKSRLNTPDFLTSAMKGTVVASIIMLFIPLSPLMMEVYLSVIYGDFMRNQLISPVF